MMVNKKFDRFKQWTNEKLGASEAKTTVSDDFKSLEQEMQLKHEGMQRLQTSMTTYVKAISKRSEGEDREKNLAVGHLGATMISHGEDYEPDSVFGSSLVALGRANEGIARAQENYIQNATSTWLDSLERSLVQMKEYQSARKKLDSRRLAYDTSLSKMERSKKEDFRMEEELRSQKAKYEESQEDVVRRMQDIKEAEADSVQDLTAFLESELAYYDRCREVLVQLKRDWPADRQVISDYREARRPPPRSRSNTVGSYSNRMAHLQEEESYEDQRSYSRHTSRGNSPRRDYEPTPALPTRPSFNRANTAEPRQGRESPAPMPRLTRVPTEPSALLASRTQLRPTNTKRGGLDTNVFTDPSDDHENDSPDRYNNDYPPSPATSFGSVPTRTASWTSMDLAGAGGKKAPPPPPPSRAKKPAPPPPPMKRSGLSTSEVPREY